MSETEYYDGTRLLSTKDINGNTPEIFICTSNRNAGKTTYFARLCVNRFLDKHEKFAILYRFNYELDNCADKFFKDIGSLFFKGMTMSSKRLASGIFHELYLDEECCGYAISLNSADQIKKYSHLFSDVKRIMFDEFQSETNHYCNNEVDKLISIHTSIARGQGEQVRYVPIYMIGNPVSIINPYYVELDISQRLRSNTKFLKGDGFVLEQGFIESASLAQKESGFNRAFKKNKYIGYATESIYLNDNLSFIEKPKGQGRYVLTIKYNNKQYALREYVSMGIIYCDDSVDVTYPTKLTVTTDDHQINYLMVNRSNPLILTLRYYFEKGCFRFKDLQCKERLLKTLSY